MSKIDFSIIIVSYKNLEVLVECIDSIYKFNDIGKRLEVIVVDNSPDNKVYDYVNSNYNNVIILKNENRGFGEANNVGANIAKGEFLLFLNPDTILIEPIFKFAINTFAENPKLTLFGVKLVNKDLEWNMSYYFIDKHDFLSGQIIRFLNKYNIFLNYNMYISGANIFIRKLDFYKAGMFDEKIFMYYEEPDLIKRVKNLGGKIDYFKSKKIIHLEGQTVGCNEDALKRRLESARYYSKKYNLKFINQLRSEIRYNKIKYTLYKLFNSEKKHGILETIKLLREFGEGFE
jgi:hypothetical protein